MWTDFFSAVVAIDNSRSKSDGHRDAGADPSRNKLMTFSVDHFITYTDQKYQSKDDVALVDCRTHCQCQNCVRLQTFLCPRCIHDVTLF